jgi:hypothetical protein
MVGLHKHIIKQHLLNKNKMFVNLNSRLSKAMTRVNEEIL